MYVYELSEYEIINWVRILYSYILNQVCYKLLDKTPLLISIYLLWLVSYCICVCRCIFALISPFFKSKFLLLLYDCNLLIWRIKFFGKTFFSSKLNKNWNRKRLISFSRYYNDKILVPKPQIYKTFLAKFYEVCSFYGLK